MKFVETYLNKHHLLHAPHKWFLALLSSPIHFAELHYKKKYHLKFVHARKLFLFDITLLLSVFVLAISAIFWWAYNPTITNLVYVNVKVTPERIISGDYVTYNITYSNDSEITLVNPYLAFELPVGFILENAFPKEQFNYDKQIFNVPNIGPKTSGEVVMTGRFFGTPDTDIHLNTTLIYTQEGKKRKEFKRSPSVSILRGSILTSKLEMPVRILSKTTVPFVLTISNKGEIAIKDITIPLDFPNGINLINTELNKGNYKNNTWLIDELEPEEESVLTGSLNFDLSTTQKSINIAITPLININNTNIPQKTLGHSISVVHPRAILDASWKDATHALPGETALLELDIKNEGDIGLSNAKISISVPMAIVDIDKLVTLNQGSYLNGVFSIEAIQNLNPGETKNINLNIPIKYVPQGGTNITLTLTPKLDAEILEITGQKYSTSVESPPLAIGTQILINAELRYYTNEGDQLGRGSLPPQVGKETKYWTLINIQNTTSKIQNVTLKATLPKYVVWTDKTSVSHGQDVVFDPSNRLISWNTSSLNPHETAGVYFELAVTPSPDQIGTTPVLLNNISVTGYDIYTSEQVTRISPNLDISLQTDRVGQQKGTIIQ